VRRPRHNISPIVAKTLLPLGERIRPWFLGAMTALLAARPLFPSERAADDGDGMPVVMCWLCLAAIWLLTGLLSTGPYDSGQNEKGPMRYVTLRRFTALDWAVLLFFTLHSIAAVVAVWRGSPRPALNMLWTWIALGLVFFLARQIVRTQHEVRAVTAAMIALAVGIAVHGCYQSAVELPALKAAYAADPDALQREAGMSFGKGMPERELLRRRIEGGEPTSGFGLSNSLAAYLAPWLYIALGLTWHARRERGLLIRGALCVLPLAACLVLTRSRSAMVALAVGFAVTFGGKYFKHRSFWKYLLSAVAVVLFIGSAAILSPAVRNRAYRAAISLEYRFEYWQSSLAMISQSPVLGCGPGNFQDEYTRYKLPQASEEVSDPHNFLLEIWATAGTPALLAFLAAAGLFVAALFELPEIDSDESEQSENERTLAASKSSASAAPFVYGGLLLGMLWGYPLARISAAFPGEALWMIGIPSAFACLSLLNPWVRKGRCPRWLFTIAIIVLLVDLLTTGGIGLPGIAQTLWLLAALVLVSQWGPWGTGVPQTPLTQAPNWAIYFAAAAIVVLGGLCYQTAYIAAMKSPILVREAREAIIDQKYDDARELAAKAIAADPLSGDAQIALADAALYDWRMTNSEDSHRQFTEADRRAQQLSPHLAAVWHASGMRHKLAYEQSKDAKPQELAEWIRSLKKAVEYYPASPLYHGNLALAYDMAGNHAAALEEAGLALHYDELTPHEDKKLPAELRKKLEGEFK
jgi:hypothetical protein